MKTIKKGKEIKRVSDKDADRYIKDGYSFCAKKEWKKNVRDVDVVEKETKKEKK